MTERKLFYSVRLLAAAAVLVLATILPLFTSNSVSAADLAKGTVRFDRIQTSAATTGTVCAQPSTASTEVDVQVTFPTGYTLGAAGTFTVNTTNLAWPTGGTIWPGITTASAVSSQTVTFTSGDLAVGTLYCFNWTNSAAVTIKSSASPSNTGTITTRAAGSTPIDTTTFSTASVTSDQIAISATVPSTFSFALNATSDPLGTLSTSGVTTSPTPRTATLSTNAKNGWTIWAKDANVGLNSVTASATIASTTPGTNSTLAAGTPGYNTGITTSQVGGSGTITVAVPFVGIAAGQGGGLDTSLRPVASSNGTADTAVLTLKNNVAIGNTTAAAADYADTITVIGAGLF